MVAQLAGLDELTEQMPVIAFDEIHKFGKWRGWLKGFFDLYADRSRIAWFDLNVTKCLLAPIRGA